MKKKKKYDGVDIICFVCLTLFAILIIIPFWNAVVLSFETREAWVKHPFSILPAEFTLANYDALLSYAGGLLVAYRNTILLAAVGTLVGMTVSLMVSYGFTREFPGRKFFFFLTIFTMFFGGGLVPTYLMLRDLHLLNKMSALVLLSVPSAYNIIIMKNGFEGIPKALPEAAMIDGANDLTIFACVMLPLQKAMIATFSLFTVVGYWNSWYWPMLIINDGKKTVLQTFLRAIINNASKTANAANDPSSTTIVTYAIGTQMAAVFVVMVPIMLVYPFLQKYFVKGVLIGGVKM